jgi:predicted transcriptional regulator of viral defense system
MSSLKQRTIQQLAQNNGGIVTKKMAVDALRHTYYCNAAKYVGEILQNMAKKGLLLRIKAGTYQLPDSPVKKQSHIPPDTDQLSLFDQQGTIPPTHSHD